MIDEDLVVNGLSIFKLRCTSKRGSDEENEDSDGGDKDSKDPHRVDSVVRTRRAVESAGPTPADRAFSAQYSLEALAALAHGVPRRLNKANASSRMRALDEVVGLV